MSDSFKQTELSASFTKTSGGCGGCQPSSCGGCGGGSFAHDPRLPKSNTDARTPLPTPSFAGSLLDIAPTPSSAAIASMSHSALEKVLGPMPSQEQIAIENPWIRQEQERSEAKGGSCGSGCGCGSDQSSKQAEKSEETEDKLGNHADRTASTEAYIGDDTYLGDLTAWLPPSPNTSTVGLQRLARREFLRQLLIGGIAGIGLLQGVACKPEQRAEWTQQHYYRLSPQDRKEVIARLEREYWNRYRKHAKVSMKPARKGVLFGYALDLSLCVGCRKCVYACAEENNLSRDPQIHWIKVLQLDAGHGLDLHHGTPFYDPAKVPETGKTYVPVACQQCADPPCTKICPVGATWREPDGITVIDYNWCIGCRYCMAACPYDARAFNWGTPSVPASQLNTDMHYLGNRPRMKGVVDKCTFCIQRVRENRLPACVEACPVGARKFGDLNDPNGELQYLLKKKKVMVLKEELNTKPQFFYYY